MTRRGLRVLAPPAGLSLILVTAACGGAGADRSSSSGRPSSSASLASSAARTATTAAPAPASTAPAGTTRSATATASSTVSSSISRPPEVPRRRFRRLRPPPTTGAAVNARLPASLAIGAGGTLTPPVVSGPAGVAIALTVVDRDRVAHTLTVTGPSGRRTFRVAAGATITATLAALRSGAYTLRVDGRVRGSIATGSAPGP